MTLMPEPSLRQQFESATRMNVRDQLAILSERTQALLRCPWG